MSSYQKYRENYDNCLSKYYWLVGLIILLSIFIILYICFSPLKIDTYKKGTDNLQSTKKDSTKKHSAKKDSIKKDSIKKDSVKKDSIDNFVPYVNTPQKVVEEQNDYLFNLYTKLQKLQNDVGMYLIKNTVADNKKIQEAYMNSFQSCTPEKIVYNLSQIPREKLAYFTLDGKDIKEPIMYMFNKDPELYKLVGETGVLTFLGKIIAFTSWIEKANIKNINTLNTFISCVSVISFTEINTWQYIADQQSQLNKCI